VVAPDGTWAITPTTPLPEGLNNLTATATDPAGNTSAPATLPITIDTTPPATGTGAGGGAGDERLHAAAGPR
jgi:hypothetical protein